MRLTLVALSLLLTGSALAQSPATAAMQRLNSVQASITACPANMTVQQRGAPETVWTVASEDAATLPKNSLGTGVHVELNSQATHLQQAELVVDYVIPGARVMPAGAAMSTRTKTFHVVSSGGTSLTLAGDLLVGTVSGVTRVHLLSLKYTDGTSWHAAPGHDCSVEPSLYVPVAAR